MRDNGRVVIGASLEAIASPGAGGTEVLPPLVIFAEAAAKLGIHQVLRDTDSTVRRCFTGREEDSSLSWAAAGMIEATYRDHPGGDGRNRWIRYYGPPYRGLYGMSYNTALDQPAGYFRGKVVFIGGKPGTLFVAQLSDQERTPYTRWTGEYASGVEIQATMFENLIHHEWLSRLSIPAELALIIVAAVVFGGGLAPLRPGTAAAISLGAVVLGTALSVWIILHSGVWFSWVTVVGAQVPCAFGYAVFRTRASPVPESLVSRRPAAGLGTAAPPPAQAAAGLQSGGSSGDDATQREATPGSAGGPPVIPDHEVLRCIGEGGYGAVWLARNAVGLYHAVKVVYRRDFKRAQPYEREFKGIKNFMPVSFNHAGMVHILHVGRNDQQGYFYYIMELADNDRSQERLDPKTYIPRTLATVIKARGRLPVKQCLQWFVPLADALAYLHQEQLVHRDVKPSNIIFVRGVPKLADIGLVTGASPSQNSTYVGTEGYIPPEGPGTMAADIFGFGKVMYEACTGLDRRAYPNPPAGIPAEEMESLSRFVAIVKRACEANPQGRYGSVSALHTDLLQLVAKLE
jgi:hypothetical protein